MPGHDPVFQQDGAPAHNRARRELTEAGIPVVQWPPNSPDLNPIENVWSILKQRVYRYQRRPTTADELWERISTEWQAMRLQSIENLADSMPSRITAVIQARGNTMGEY